MQCLLFAESFYWIKRTNDRSGMKARISYEYKPRKDDIFISTFSEIRHHLDANDSLSTHDIGRHEY